MTCPTCNLELVDGEVSLHGRYQNRPWAKPAGQKRGPTTEVSARMKVCPQCGFMQLFVDDPGVFQSVETRTLPRSVGGKTASTETLPRSV